MAAIIKETPTACVNTCHYLEHIITHDATKCDLTAASGKHYNCRAGAIVPAGFHSLNVSGGHNHHALFGGFFVSVALCAQLVGRVWEAHACRFPFTPVCEPALGLPFLFHSEKGEYINENGANTMANTQQAESANLQNQYNKLLEASEKRAIELLHCIDMLDDLYYRIGFLTSAIAQSSDWIDEHAGNELCCTIGSIYKDMDTVLKRLNTTRKEVRT